MKSFKLLMIIKSFAGMIVSIFRYLFSVTKQTVTPLSYSDKNTLTLYSGSLINNWLGAVICNKGNGASINKGFNGKVNKGRLPGVSINSSSLLMLIV